MRKLFINNKNEMGAIGIGALIVLIAMILVAGVAASVIISTSNTLQSQALNTATQTTREVSSGISVLQVDGKVFVNGTGVKDLTILDLVSNGARLVIFTEEAIKNLEEKLKWN